MQNDNPYRAPYSPLYGKPRASRVQLEIEPASKWRRFFNNLIDSFVYYLLVMLVASILLAVGGQGAAQWIRSLGLVGGYAFGFLILMFYYIAMESVLGFTVGKLITGTRVVNEEGEKPNLVQTFLRTLCRFIPFEPLSILFSGETRGWHDSLSGTYVVRKP